MPDALAAGSLSWSWFGLLAGTGANAGVSETQDGIEPAVALAMARKGGDCGPWRTGSPDVRSGAFPKVRHSHGRKR